MFSWLNAREASQFGHSLADFFAERVPPDAIPATEKKPLRKTGEVIAKMHTKLIDYRSSHKLNVYQKAKLANAFQWRLFDLGYDKVIVQEIAKELLRVL